MTTAAQEQAHRLQLAKWCAMHKMPAPTGPVVDAFVTEMGAKHYGVEETWDAYLWFKSGWEYLDRALLAATGSILSQYAADKIREHAKALHSPECPPSR